MKSILKVILQLYICISLYTPLFWYLFHLKKTYYSFGIFDLRIGEMIIYCTFSIVPIIALFYLDYFELKKNSK